MNKKQDYHQEHGWNYCLPSGPQWDGYIDLAEREKITMPNNGIKELLLNYFV